MGRVASDAEREYLLAVGWLRSLLDSARRMEEMGAPTLFVNAFRLRIESAADLLEEIREDLIPDVRPSKVEREGRDSND
ncbi:hypothetical protein AB0F17_34950 [Nonomuraea sp. NPDC026600]|uniref:hypothetical protein n=1 Tax=Nonomuraea sp. NPDC026600 TaxID=3155363 RepID=UPI0033CE7819